MVKRLTAETYTLKASIFILILMLVLIGIVGIVMSLLFTSKNTENMDLAIIISFGLFSVIVISFMAISVSQLYKAKNINTYNIEVQINRIGVAK